MATHPYDLVIPCFANNAIVRPGVRLNALLVLRPIIITDIVASLFGPDRSAVTSEGEAYGVSANLKIGNDYILSSPVRIRPDKLHSKEAGTVQPVVAISSIPAFSELAPEVITYGDGAMGLCLYVIAQYVDP